MAFRKVAEASEPFARAAIHWNKETEEYRVQFFKVAQNGSEEYQQEADYFSDDWDDAHTTMLDSLKILSRAS